MDELRGQSGHAGKVVGPAHVVLADDEDLHHKVDAMPEGAVLVTNHPRAHLIHGVNKAGALVTDEGGLLSHAALYSREHKVPSVLGTKHATQVLKTGDIVEVDANTGVVRIINRA